MKLKKTRSKCNMKSDEVFMDCGSNDVAVYSQACLIKQYEIKRLKNKRKGCLKSCVTGTVLM